MARSVTAKSLESLIRRAGAFLERGIVRHPDRRTVPVDLEALRTVQEQPSGEGVDAIGLEIQRAAVLLEMIERRLDRGGVVGLVIGRCTKLLNVDGRTGKSSWPRPDPEKLIR